MEINYFNGSITLRIILRIQPVVVCNYSNPPCKCYSQIVHNKKGKLRKSQPQIPKYCG